MQTTKKEEVLELIRKIFGDTSVSKTETYQILDEIKEEIQDYMNAL